MRSLIILEVEHGEDTDGLDKFIASISTTDVIINDYTVRVDVPECFVLDTGESPCWVGGDCVRTPGGIIHSSECYALIMEDAPDTDDGLTCDYCAGKDGSHFFDCKYI